MSREAWGPPHVEPEGLFALEASVQTQVAVTAGMRVCACGNVSWHRGLRRLHGI